MIPQMEPWFNEAEANALALYMQSGGWLTEYTKTQELEGLIADYVGSKHCIMVPNGTLALYAMLSVLGIGPGDEVIVPDMTMIATANAVRMAGATPVFVDINADTLCLNFELTKRRIGLDTTAILLVSLNGRCPNLDDFRSLDVPLLEDACQSLGSKWQGKHLGTFGLMGAFSFSSQKIISTGNGGCVVTDDDDLAQKLRLFKNFGREGGTDDYRVFGTNLKFTDLQAVVGIEQMKKLPWRVGRKKTNYALYYQLLLDLDNVRFLPTDLNSACPWFVDVLVEDRESLMAFLRDRNIGSRPMYPALRRTPVYSHVGPDWISDYMAERGLWLPSSCRLSNVDIHKVCDTIKEFYGETTPGLRKI